MASIISLLRKLIAIVLLVLGIGYGYVRYLTIVQHHSEFVDVHHRPGMAQVMMEGFDSHVEHSPAVFAWTEEQYKTRPLKGKVIFVTGATRGLGRGIAGHLAALGAKLILPCRRCDFVKLKRTVQADAVANAVKYGKFSRHDAEKKFNIVEPTVFDLDLADLDQIDAMIAKYKSEGVPATDILVHNAGLIATSIKPTKQGFETTFGVNFLAPAYLTEKMLENNLLKQKIVTVSSEEHRVGDTIAEVVEKSQVPFGALFGTGITDTMYRYGYTKLLETTYFLALARKVPSIKVIDLCPGPIASDIAMGVMWPLNEIATYILDLIFPSIDRAALSVVRLIAYKDYENITGEHFHIYQRRLARADARDVKIQDWLYETTRELIRTKKAPVVA